MKRPLLCATALLVALDAVWVATGAGCASDLTATTPGHDKCDAAGQCLPGYVCEQATMTCVLAGSPASSSGAGHGGAGTGGKPGTAHGGATGTGGTGGSTGPGTAGSGGASVTSSTHASSSTGCGDTSSDPKNCGVCGHECPAPVHGNGMPTCSGGKCGVDCTGSSDAGAFHACSESDGGVVCVDPDDPQYCGTTCAACPSGQKCEGGTCKSFCLPPLSPCNGACVDLASDPANCGTCGKQCGGTLGPPPYCNAGSCVGSGITGPGCGSLLKCGNSPYSCSPPDDPYHCGSCGNVCGTTEVCAAGGVCESYIVASGSWECGNGNSLTNWCPPTGPVPYGLCTSGSACP